MSDFSPPTVVTRDREWPSGELADLAWRWCGGPLRDLRDRTAPVALVMTNEPQTIALFFALSTLSAPLIMMPRDPRGWHSSPPVPAGTPLILRTSQAALAEQGRAIGLDVRVVPDQPAAAGDSPSFLRSPGVVVFTSGSTGAPKPAYRLMSDTIEGVGYRISALGFSSSTNVVGSLPLDRPAAINQVLILTTLLGSRLALVESTDYRGILRFFATGEYEHWTCTPAIAYVLVRAVRGRHPAPAVCLCSGRVSEKLFDDFHETFGVPLRGYYGASESPWIAVDTRPAAEVRAGIVGLPASVVVVRIGDHPSRPVPAGEVGRIWVKSALLAAGYGFPPDLTPCENIDGFWASPDVGRFQPDGSLEVIGRLDDTVRTAAGSLVNLGHVATALTSRPGVRDAVAVPLDTTNGEVIGALAEVDGPVTAVDLRAHLAAVLPAALVPRIVQTTEALPRLADGRPDRRACIERLRNLLTV